MGGGGEVVLCSGPGDGSKIFFFFRLLLYFRALTEIIPPSHFTCVHVEIIHLSIDLAGASRKEEEEPRLCWPMHF